MGIPIIPPGWPIGEPEDCIQALDNPLWVPGNDPEFTYASFSGINLCAKCDGWFSESPNPPNPIKMEQQPPYNVALYRGIQDGYACQWQACSPCHLKLATTAGPTLFMGTAIPGATFFTNMWDCADAMHCGDGGNGVVTWCPGAHKILFDYNLDYALGTMYDFWPGSFKKIIYRFANIRTPMNLLVEWQIPK